MLKSMLAGFYIYLPGSIPMLALAWRLEKETFHESVTCYCFHLFYCESNFNNFLKLRNLNSFFFLFQDIS